MPARIVLLLLLLLLGMPAGAQGAVPKNVKRVIADFRNDGRIDPCRHTAKTYRATLKEVEENLEAYVPDFPIAVQAAREARVEARCEEKAAEEEQAERERQAEEEEAEEQEQEEAAGAPSSTPTPAPTPAPAPVTPAPTSTPEAAAPSLPQTDPPAVEPAPSETPSPEPSPEVTPAPTEPPGTGAGITPGVPPATPNKPDVVLTRLSDNREARLPLGILAGVLAAALLAGAAALIMRRLGWGEERLAGVRHAFAEASYRTGGTWQNFTDWVRLGR